MKLYPHNTMQNEKLQALYITCVLSIQVVGLHRQQEDLFLDQYQAC